MKKELEKKEKKLRELVARWTQPSLRQPGGIEDACVEYGVAYGNWAYLCGEHFHLGEEEATIDLAETIGLRPGMKLLDAACYLGGPARQLAKTYQVEVTGLDISLAAVLGAQKITAAAGLEEQVKFVQGDAWNMPFAGESFQVVWGQDSWFHEEGLFEECARVLKPNGWIAFTNSVRGEIYDVMEDDEAKITYEAYTGREYAAMLAEAGFKVILQTDITEEMIAEWEKLLKRLIEERPYWESKIGRLCYKHEQEALEIILQDYYEKKIEHQRITARKEAG